MQAVFHKIAIEDCWWWRRFTRVIIKAAVVAELHTISHAWHGDASVVSHLSHDIAEILNVNILKFSPLRGTH